MVVTKKKKKNWPKETALTNINLIKADYLSSIMCPTVTTHWTTFHPAFHQTTLNYKEGFC